MHQCAISAKDINPKAASPIPLQRERANQQDEFLAAKVQYSQLVVWLFSRLVVWYSLSFWRGKGRGFLIDIICTIVQWRISA